MAFQFRHWSTVVWIGMATIGATLSPRSVLSQEAATIEAADKEDAKEDEATSETEEDDPQSFSVDLRDDTGMAAVQEAEADGGVKYAPDKTAQESLEEYLNAHKGWKEGWDAEKKRIFTIAAQKINVDDDPSSDKDFYLKREMLAKQVVLRAKADIISAIRTKMSAIDRLAVPGTDVNTKFGEAFEAAENKLKRQQQQVSKLLAEFDAAEAEALAGATTRDRLNALLDAAIKRLDKEYSSGNIEAKKVEQLAKAKQRHADAINELSTIEKQVKALKSTVASEQTSVVELASSMPLLGATVIEQTESWNKADETYEVAVLVCWSAKLEAAARAALSGDPIITDAPESDEQLTVQEWLAKHDLGQMVGPRQFTDSMGQRWFIGITARPTSKNAAVDSNNKDLVQVNARQMAAFSLFADVDVQQTARQFMQVLSKEELGKSTTDADKSLEQSMTQSFKDMQINGLGPLTKRIVTHPLTGQKIYVAAYGISPDSARAAMEAERQAALAAISLHKSQAFAKGRTEALDSAVNASKNDSEAKSQGRQKGDSELSPTKSKSTTKNSGKNVTGTGADSNPDKKSTATKSNATKSGSTKAGKVKVKDDF